MKGVNKKIKEDILSALNSIHHGATISELSGHIPFERHTISKYLSILKREGVVDRKKAGKATFWFLNKAPLKTIAQSPKESRTYIENTLLNLISSSPSGIMVIDRNYTIQFMNTVLKDMYGSLEGQTFYESILGLTNPLKLKKISAIIHNSAKRGQFQTIDTKERILNINASHMNNPDGSHSCILIIEDITEQKKDEEMMKILSRVVEQTADMVMITTKTGEITYINPAFEKATGYKKVEVLGKQPNILKSGKHSEKFYADLWKRVLSGKKFAGLFIDKKKNGKLFFEEKIISPLFDNKKITHFVSTGKILEREVKK